MGRRFVVLGLLLTPSTSAFPAERVGASASAPSASQVQSPVQQSPMPGPATQAPNPNPITARIVIWDTGDRATVKLSREMGVKAGMAPVKVAFASYKIFGTQLHEQVLYSENAEEQLLDERLSITIFIPNCNYQLDVVQGDRKVPPIYGPELITYSQNFKKGDCVPGEEPPPPTSFPPDVTPPDPVPSPIPSPTPTTSPNPSPSPTPSPSPNPQPVPCEVKNPASMEGSGEVTTRGAAVHVNASYTVSTFRGEVQLFWVNGSRSRVKESKPVTAPCAAGPVSGTISFTSTEPDHLPQNGARYSLRFFAGGSVRKSVPLN